MSKRFNLLILKLLTLILLLTASFFFIEYQKNNKAICKDCNVVLISLDTVRAQDMSCYGYNINTTPFLNRFVKDAVLFKNDFSQATFTFPSHMSFLTSTYPSCTEFIFPGRDVLHHQVLTLPEVLKALGYTTIWNGILTDPHLSLTAGYERGIDLFFSYEWKNGINWIKKHPNEKFYVFFHTYVAHDPYTPTKSDMEQLGFIDLPDKVCYDRCFDKLFSQILKNMSFMQTIMSTEDFAKYSLLELENLSVNETINAVENFLATRTNNSGMITSKFSTETFKLRQKKYYQIYNDSDPFDLILLQKLYDARILKADKMVENVINELKLLGLYNKTIIIITSDHGEEFREHGSIRHYFIHDESTHVPLIIRIPGVQPSVREDFVEGVDIMPTVLAALGVSLLETTQGRNLLPYLLSGKRVPYKPVYTYIGNIASVRTKDWRFTILNLTEKPRYELLKVVGNNDVPGNVFQEYPEVVENLNRTLFNWLATNQKCKYKSTHQWSSDISDEVKQKILKTGYW